MQSPFQPSELQHTSSEQPEHDFLLGLLQSTTSPEQTKKLYWQLHMYPFGGGSLGLILQPNSGGNSRYMINSQPQSPKWF